MPKPNLPTPVGQNKGKRFPGEAEYSDDLPTGQGKVELKDPVETGDIEPKSATNTERKEALISSINQIFALFRLNYHNQFSKAYPDLDTLNQAKRLWLTLFADIPPKRILHAAQQAIKTSEYLPTLSKIHQYLQTSLNETLGCPSAHSAYVEACRATEPKSEFNWRHPIVYWAGKATGWYLLASEPEAVTFPIFESHYQLLCERIDRGESIEIPLPKRLTQAPKEQPLKPKQQQQHLSVLRKHLNL